MGFLKRSPGEEPSRRYLQLAPPGPRTESLFVSCVLKILPTPVAADGRYGNVVSIDELQSAAAVVREVMVQDRDLSAWVARKSVVQLNALLGAVGHGEDMVEAGLNANMLLGLQAVGIEPTAVTSDGELALRLRTHDDDPSGPDLPAALDIATSAMTVLLAALGRTPPHERREFRDLYSQTADAEAKGYRITAWSSILLARLMTSGTVPRFQPINLPAMWCAGWYPNPSNTGATANGDAQAQRYWDGAAWTERMRILQGGRWNDVTVSLHEPPS